ncbi:MAG: hypothetical protein KIT80_07730 [Chitinophagaceae bacterium]|nr:hypothetical protein [Chitinophagaceae bacterium]MCW5926783.1 hypothetical protein [Chitinophagaceae bacterium]
MKLLYSILFCLLVMLTACSDPVDPVSVNHRLIYNNDGTEILGNNWFGKRPLTIEDLHRYVDMIAGSQVTTYMICSGSDFFYYRSKFGRIIGEDKNDELDCGKDTAYFKVLNNFYRNALALEKEGTDIVEATLKRAKEKKLEAFVTFRMNDLHFADTARHCPLQYSDFWIAHPEYWTNDTTLSGWNSSRALDFAHEAVRTYKLGIIREQLLKYGALMDGYELDFMRFIVYFKKNEAAENAPLITELVRSAKGIADSVGRVYNKKILLTARVPATINDCLQKGLDVKEWTKQGLVDFLTMGVHWRGEPAMPVEAFTKELGSDIPVYATMDDGGYNPREVWSHGMYRGMASHALAQGASGMNLFNYFLTVYNEAGQQLQPEPGTVVCRTIAPELLRELGSLETLRKRSKIYCLSDGATSYDLTPNSPLPLTVNETAEVGLYVGDDVKADQPEEVILFVRTKTPGAFSVSMNGHELQPAGSAYPQLYDKLQGLTDSRKVTAFVVPADRVIPGNNTIRFSSHDAAVTIQRVELALKYGPVEQHGYF